LVKKVARSSRTKKKGGGESSGPPFIHGTTGDKLSGQEGSEGAKESNQVGGVKEGGEGSTPKKGREGLFLVKKKAQMGGDID